MYKRFSRIEESLLDEDGQKYDRRDVSVPLEEKQSSCLTLLLSVGFFQVCTNETRVFIWRRKKDFSNMYAAFVRHLDYVSAFRSIKKGRKEMSGNVHPTSDYSLWNGVYSLMLAIGLNISYYE